jgi:hypothetical protein
MDKKMKTNIEVGGVILTEQAIARLKDFQQHGNEDIRICRERIADAICFIGRNLETVPENELEQVHFLITDLSYIRDHFNDLQKP